MCKQSKNTSAVRRGVSRRDLIRYGVGGALGVMAMGPLGRGFLQPAEGAPIDNHKRLVVMYCYGGYDGMNMVVPHELTAYRDRRPTIAIDAADALDIGKAGYGFNPELTNIASLYNNGEGAIFQKVGYPNRNLSHFTSQDIYSKGVRGSFDPLGLPESGWLARFADNYTTDSLGVVSVGVGRPLDFEGSQSSNPLMLGSLGSFQFSDDDDYRANHDERLAAVNQMLGNYSGSTLDTEAQAALQQSLDLVTQIEGAVDTYVPPSGMAYPTSTPGRYLEDIARMIQAGFNSKIFFTGFGGWDNHSNQLSAMGNRMQRLDDAIGAFAAHCTEMGVWDDTILIVVSEFGRRNFENGSNGTDHGHGNCFLAFSGSSQFNGGYYGPDLTNTEINDERWLGYEIDFRDIYKEMITDWFQGDAGLIFPEPQDINQNLGYLS